MILAREPRAAKCWIQNYNSDLDSRCFPIPSSKFINIQIVYALQQKFSCSRNTLQNAHHHHASLNHHPNPLALAGNAVVQNACTNPICLWSVGTPSACAKPSTPGTNYIETLNYDAVSGRHCHQDYPHGERAVRRQPADHFPVLADRRPPVL